MPADNYHHVGSKSIGFMSLIFAAQGGKPTLLTRNKASVGRNRQQKGRERKANESRPTDLRCELLYVLCPLRA